MVERAVTWDWYSAYLVLLLLSPRGILDQCSIEFRPGHVTPLPSVRIMAYTNGTTTKALNGSGNDDSSSADVNYDCLIVGAGPAGASLACFLTQNGMTGLIVTKEPSNADTPRAHITNMAAIDVGRLLTQLQCELNTCT